MGNSLEDQLLALGFARKSEPQQRKPTSGRDEGRRNDNQSPGDKTKSSRPLDAGRHNAGRHAGKSGRAPESRRGIVAGEPDLAQAYAARARGERQERERLEREAQDKARDKRERKMQLAALLDGKSLNLADADVARHFTHGAKIRRVYVTAAQLVRLNAGELGVVQKDGRYLLVDRDIALAVQAISAEAMILLPDPNAPVEDDIPPDLIW